MSTRKLEAEEVRSTEVSWWAADVRENVGREQMLGAAVVDNQVKEWPEFQCCNEKVMNA